MAASSVVCSRPASPRARLRRIPKTFFRRPMPASPPALHARPRRNQCWFSFNVRRTSIRRAVAAGVPGRPIGVKQNGPPLIGPGGVGCTAGPAPAPRPVFVSWGNLRALRAGRVAARPAPPPLAGPRQDLGAGPHGTPQGSARAVTRWRGSPSLRSFPAGSAKGTRKRAQAPQQRVCRVRCAAAGWTVPHDCGERHADAAAHPVKSPLSPRLLHRRLGASVATARPGAGSGSPGLRCRRRRGSSLGTCGLPAVADRGA